MIRRSLVLVVLLVALPATARADTLLDPAPSGVNLTAGVGWTAWAEPAEDTGWRLVVRSPGGAVTRPDIDDFPGPPDASIGSGRGADPRVLAVYARSRGGGSDVYALDLATGKEHVVSGISTAAADELAPSIAHGRLAFVRRGGRHPGVYGWNGLVAARRLSTDAAIQTAINDSRVAWTTARAVSETKVSGRGPTLTLRTATRPRSLVLTLYRIGWLEADGRVMQTNRISRTGTRAFAATRALPAATQSIGLDGRQVALRLGPDGLRRISPALTFPG